MKKSLVLPIALFLSSVSVLGCLAAETGEPTVSSLSDWRNALEIRLEKDQTPLRELNALYGSHLKRLRDEMQNEGELEQALMAKKELETLDERIDRDYATFPRLQEMRRIYEEQRSEVEELVMGRERETYRELGKQLEDLKNRLTKDGRLSAALAVIEEQEQISRRIGQEKAPGTKAELFVNCDNEFELAHNGRVIARGEEIDVVRVELTVRPGDVLVAKVSDFGRKTGFACVIVRDGKEPIVSDRGTWRSLPSDYGVDWKNVDENVTTTLSDPATNQLWKAAVESATGVKCTAVWPRGNPRVGYLLLEIED